MRAATGDVAGGDDEGGTGGREGDTEDAATTTGSDEATETTTEPLPSLRLRNACPPNPEGVSAPTQAHAAS